MTYVISDLHGYPLDRFLALLDKAEFSDEDYLFMLGDVIDRNGDGGVKMLEWLLYQPNVQLILGNHEAMLLSCDFLFKEVTEESIEGFTRSDIDLLMTYQLNGGNVTLGALHELKKEKPETVEDILEYLSQAPLYETATVCGRDYLFVHSGMENFDRSRKLSNYSADELLWARPTLKTVYFDEITTVFGHTPTLKYGEEYRGRILYTETWINIDAGAGWGMEPVLLRLDDMKEFRLE